MAYGTNVVGGVTPGKGGTTHLDEPVFNTVRDAVKETEADVSVIFVPASVAADAIMEAAENGHQVDCGHHRRYSYFGHDTSQAYYLQDKPCRLIGPNCPGVISPGLAKNEHHAFIHLKGALAWSADPGTLTYEAVDQLTKLGLGQSTCIGIGGDPIIGTNTRAKAGAADERRRHRRHHYDWGDRWQHGDRSNTMD